ncbi:MAG TPA: hypothetical protein VHU23_16000 [Rhizomicrobium sp.]|jgi:hypothetical protein|nr:hypothetical protein [Rhizomicrobium sp.]
MPFKTNYGQERAQRNRTKEAKQQEKLARREEASAKRKAARDSENGADAENRMPGTEETPKPAG